MAQPEENRPKTAKTDVILTEGDRIREGEEAEELAVPGRELLTEALEAITQAAASVLPEDFPPVPPPTRPRTGGRAVAGRDRRAQDADDRLRGGPRGPQDPGPWGLDELLRGDPPWGASEDSPMNEGSEPTAVPTEPPK
jgi:hypothetical protein